MRVAYADPPYLGCCALYGHHHPDGRCWDDIETHRLLIERLVRDFPDGFALSLSSRSLRTLLPLCPEDVRIGAWVKTFSTFKRGVRPAYAWEPVVFVGGRNPPRHAHCPPPARRSADDTEGLRRRAHHAAARPHRREARARLRLDPRSARGPRG